MGAKHLSKRIKHVIALRKKGVYLLNIDHHQMRNNLSSWMSTPLYARKQTPAQAEDESRWFNAKDLVNFYLAKRRTITGECCSKFLTNWMSRFARRGLACRRKLLSFTSTTHLKATVHW